jgi:hypothetical protein
MRSKQPDQENCWSLLGLQRSGGIDAEGRATAAYFNSGEDPAVSKFKTSSRVCL